MKPDAPASHYYSHLRIDHTISGFKVGSEEEKAVLLIYEHLMYESKPNPPCKEVPRSYRDGDDCTRGPFFTVREHDHKPPPKGSHKEVLIFGSTQLSKTPEAAASAWCAFFIDGCVPIIGVRNKGGANTGSVDMAKGVEDLNKRIKQLFFHDVHHGYINLPATEAEAAKFRLQPRKTSDQEHINFDVHSLKLHEPQVLIICMNAGQVKVLIGDKGNRATSKAAACAGLIDIMKGTTNHPYPPKCHDPYEPYDDDANRLLSRLYFILDEDGMIAHLHHSPSCPTVGQQADRPTLARRPQPLQQLERHGAAPVQRATRGNEEAGGWAQKEQWLVCWRSRGRVVR